MSKRRKRGSKSARTHLDPFPLRLLWGVAGPGNYLENYSRWREGVSRLRENRSRQRETFASEPDASYEPGINPALSRENRRLAGPNLPLPGSPAAHFHLSGGLRENGAVHQAHERPSPRRFRVGAKEFRDAAKTGRDCAKMVQRFSVARKQFAPARNFCVSVR